MSLFGKLFKKNGSASSVADIPSEIYQSVHVMHDDVNVLEGKPKEAYPGKPSSDPNPLQANNPFLGGSMAAPVPGTEAGSLKGKTTAVEKGNKKPFVYGSVSVLVVIVVLATWYFFLRDWNAPSEEPSVNPVVSDTSIETPVSEDFPGTPKDIYSVGMPNYLQIDPESDTATPDGISLKINSVVEKVLSMNASGPVEFLVRDMNNNPIAFSRFAYLAKLGIPEDVLSDIDEPFSIYFVPDNMEVRIALAVDAKDPEKLAALVNSGESGLPTWFEGLLYGGFVSVPKATSFRSGTYGTMQTRFSTFDGTGKYSFDYAFIGKKWVIGASMNAFRATLDKIVTEGSK